MFTCWLVFPILLTLGLKRKGERFFCLPQLCLLAFKGKASHGLYSSDVQCVKLFFLHTEVNQIFSFTLPMQGHIYMK